MIFEIVGSRIMGPYFGTSIFVWTSLIGVIMGGMSLGYWLGGKISGYRNDSILLAWIIFISGLLIMVTALGNDYILRRIIKYIPEFRFQTILAVIVLFAPAAFSLSMVLPYSAKMVVSNVSTSGSTVGNLYSLSTTGSIIGTFIAGFLLVPALGYAVVVFASGVLLLLISFSLFVLEKKPLFLVSALMLSAGLIVPWLVINVKPKDYIDTDTQYNRVLIYNTNDAKTGRPIKMLRINDENSSAMFLDHDNDLVFEVLKYYRLVEHFNPGFKNSLMIGGSGYAFPKDYLNRYPFAAIDVVEIDPGLTELAKHHFNLPENTKLNIYHEDGRTYLNKCEKKYDAVFMDAYKSMLTIPYQLTTIEAVRKIYNVLNDRGAVYANIISSLLPQENHFLLAEMETYKRIFPQVYLFAIQYPNPTEIDKSQFQNFMLVGLKSKEKPRFISENEEMNQYLSHFISVEPIVRIDVLTDEYAPVEYFASKALNHFSHQK
jgi:spermidine synthase